MRLRKPAGVTLLELMMVVAIACLMLVLAAPNFRSALARQALDSAISAFTSDVRLARSEAIKRGHAVSICRSSDGAACETNAGAWHTGWLVFTDPNGDEKVDTNEMILRVQGQASGVGSIEVSAGAVPKKAFTFRATGLTSGSQSNVKFSSGAGASAELRILCISSTGRVSERAAGVSTC